MDKISGNPFVCRNKFSFWDYIKFAIMTIVAVPIRALLLVLLMVIFYITVNIVYVIKWLVKPQEYHKVKKYYVAAPIFILRCVACCCGFWRMPIIDMNSNPGQEAPVLIMVPHSSIYDMLAIVHMGYPSFVARTEVQTNWVLGNFVALADPILVKREQFSSRQETIATIKERALTGQILILPEGTCTNRAMTIRYKLGAFYPGLPVQPIVLIYGTDDDIDNLSWTWEGPIALSSMYMTLCKFYTSLSIVKMPIYRPTKEEQQNPGLFATNVQKHICSQTYLRFGFYMYNDVRFLRFCREAGIPRSPVCIKFVSVCHKMCVELVQEAFKKIKEPEVFQWPATEVFEKLTTSEPKEIVRSRKSKESLVINVKSSDGKSLRKRKSLPEGPLDISRQDIGTSGLGLGKGFGTKRKESDHSFEMSNLNAKGKINEKRAIVYTLLHVIRYVTEKLDTGQPLDNTQELIRIFEIKDRYPNLSDSTVFDDFFFAFKCNEAIKVTTTHLCVVLTLCDVRVSDLWDRIESCLYLLAGNSTDSEPVLSLEQFKTLVWYLLGIEAELITDDLFEGKQITFEFIKNNLVKLFERAVEDNAEDLLSTPLY